MNDDSKLDLYANQRVRVVPNFIRRVRRDLQGRGNINVQVGEEVSPQDIIGEYTISGGYRRFNLAEMLSSNPLEAGKYLQRSIGQRIYKGEVLAYKQSRLLQGKKLITSPIDGVLDFYDENTGELSVSFLPKGIELPAAVYGIVEYIDPNKGQIIIKTQVTDIIGILGTGKSRDGILEMIGGRGDLINASRFGAKSVEHILAGGSLVYNEALTAAISVGVHGIITGGINAKDYKAMTGGVLEIPLKIGRDVGISIIATEGFGSIPMGEDVYAALQVHDGKFVIIDGNRAKLTLPSFDSNTIFRIRATQLPSLEKEPLVEAIKEVEAVKMELGQKIRILAPPFIGEQGVINFIDSSPTLLPSGVRTYLITVETKSRKIIIPYSNVEVITE